MGLSLSEIWSGGLCRCEGPSNARVV